MNSLKIALDVMWLGPGGGRAAGGDVIRRHRSLPVQEKMVQKMEGQDRIQCRGRIGRMGMGKGGIEDGSQAFVGVLREHPAQPLTKQVWKLRHRVRRILPRVRSSL